MSNKQPHYRIVKILAPAMVLTSLLIGGNSARADVETLFTTAEERQTINDHRYKADPEPSSVADGASDTKLVIQQNQEEIKISFVISGITLSGSGPHSVWINSRLYEDGERLEDESRVKILAGEHVKVRITTPDGEQYFGTSGETVEVSYLAPAKAEP